MAGCVPTRHLAENERLLYRIKLSGVEQNNPENITALYQQRPNRKILGSTPYLTVYYFGKLFFKPDNIKKQLAHQRKRMDRRIQEATQAQDSSRLANMLRKREKKLTRLTRKLEQGNLLMQIGEPPVFYDSTKADATRQQIAAYLNSKGYFRNQVSYQAQTRNKKVTLHFLVTENQAYTYSVLTDSIADAAIKHIYDSTRAQSLIRVGQRYDEEVLGNERERIERLLKNLGYFQFSKQYITVNPDTSFEKNKVRLQLNIANRPSGQPHQVFRIKEVNFKADAHLERFGVDRDTIFYNGIRYLAYTHRLSPRILDKKIFIRPGQLYHLDRTNNTQQQLVNLNMFRFLNINYTHSDSTLIAHINANPSKRFQETSELGGSYSANRPGPFTNLRLTVRNIFGGAELLELGVRGALEGQYSLAKSDSSVYTKEFGGNLALVFPQFLVPFNANKYFTRYTPRSRINLMYTNINRQEFDRLNYEVTFDYIWQRSPRLQFVYTPFDITINQSLLSQDFERNLIRRRPSPNVKTTFENSFQPAFVSSMNFSLLYNSNNYNHTLDADYLRFFIEEAGILGGVIFNNESPIGRGLTFYKYGRLNFDYRRYIKLSRTDFLVSRFNFGIAKPFSGSNTLPYDKYYYAGGGTSVRAFRPRRLGPGSHFQQAVDTAGVKLYNPDGSPRREENIEQPGELLIEGNLEYRFNIYGFWNGAVFLDAGNVWMLTPDPSRERAQFQFNRFYREFGVGAGWGFRFDFTFLIARFDIATRLYDPTEFERKDRFVFRNTSFSTLIRDKTVLNLGIGYPF